MYSFGNRLRVSLFGKSHADCIGCIVKGLPVGMEIDLDRLRRRMELRKPSDGIGTPRKEDDLPVFEYGVEDGIVTQDEILLTIYNKNRDSSAYSEFNRTPRPGHADLPALLKFKDYDVSGGAQFSGRMTAPLVAAGALAEQVLEDFGIRAAAYTRSIYDVVDDNERTFDEIEGSKAFGTRACTSELDGRMRDTILRAKEKDDSVGGTVGCMIVGLKPGNGGIWFDAMDSCLAHAMFSIPAVKGVEFGKGFGITRMKGSESNDPYTVVDGRIAAKSNNMGGICGGMCDGMPVTFNVAFKPTPSIGIEQDTVDLQTMKGSKVTVKGRHDPCIVPRAVAVVEAMASITVLDQLLSF
ncbi:MAG: chorismate synthase [Candidatus Methanomethylophilaceae archaeon]|nr:chorismate synthase [Candidatus Methanomethylophilaceae archaeon]